MECASAPKRRTSSSRLKRSSCRLATRKRLAPSRASKIAVERPMPLDAPVMTTFLSFIILYQYVDERADSPPGIGGVARSAGVVLLKRGAERRSLLKQSIGGSLRSRSFSTTPLASFLGSSPLL